MYWWTPFLRTRAGTPCGCLVVPFLYSQLLRSRYLIFDGHRCQIDPSRILVGLNSLVNSRLFGSLCSSSTCEPIQGRTWWGLTTLSPFDSSGTEAFYGQRSRSSLFFFDWYIISLCLEAYKWLSMLFWHSPTVTWGSQNCIWRSGRIFPPVTTIITTGYHP